MSKRSTARKASTAPANNVHQLIRPFQLKQFSPITLTQKEVWKSFANRKNLFLSGSAGTGKTFIALYLALKELEHTEEYQKVVLVRSAVEVRAIGALPGDANEKLAPFETPYWGICEELYDDKKAYGRLKAEGKIEFLPTSFIRGSTIKDAIIIVDEYQNLSGHELDSIMTRVGNNSRIIFCGDISQSDLTKETDRRGADKFEAIIERMVSFDMIDFMPSDIVRSGLVKEYLLAKG